MELMELNSLLKQAEAKVTMLERENIELRRSEEQENSTFLRDKIDRLEMALNKWSKFSLFPPPTDPSKELMPP